MKNVFGNNISITLFGESHGDAIGAVLDGLGAGIEVDKDFIDKQLSKRRPALKTDTQRHEKDNYSILSGVFNGKSAGSPICIVIPNEDTKSKDYSEMATIARPSHADYTAFVKYKGYNDYRGGGHFSGRLTAPIVACGAIVQKALQNLGIKVGTHILKCGNVSDRDFCDYEKDLALLNDKAFPVLSDIEEELSKEILKAKEVKDSIGGIVQSAIYGLPAGIGEPFFDSLESVLSHAVFSIGGVKGIEFGLGFGFADKLGSEANDEFAIKDGKIVTKTNNNGGINGGISNGMPIVFNSVIKPTPSISKEQNTVNFVDNKEEKLVIEGRHDPAIIRRVCVVFDSIISIALADLLVQKYGTDVFLEGKL